MTSSQESSDRARKLNKPPEIESLAGAFHPHAIEVQDFSHYALVIDVRTPQEYEEDHIPGAVQLSPAVVSHGLLVTGHADDQARALVVHDSGAEGDLPPALAALVSPLKLDQAILVYCGRGGLDSLPIARALRWRGWSVDVLPGGWINYRRWVQAGLEVLPRMVSFRVIATSLGCEADRILNALAGIGHQVLNVEALMVRRRGSISSRHAPQPSQALLDSQLLQRLRAVDPRRPVWVGDVDDQVGELKLPGSMADVLGAAPIAVVEVPVEERVDRWIDDEPAWASPLKVIQALASLQSPPEAHLVERWKQQSICSLRELVASVLTGYLDGLNFARTAHRLSRPNRLDPLQVSSLEQKPLVAALLSWQPSKDAGAVLLSSEHG